MTGDADRYLLAFTERVDAYCEAAPAATNTPPDAADLALIESAKVAIAAADALDA